MIAWCSLSSFDKITVMKWSIKAQVLVAGTKLSETSEIYTLFLSAPLVLRP